METTLGQRTEGMVGLMRTTLVSSRNRKKNKLGCSGVREGERDGRQGQEDRQRPDHVGFRGYSEGMRDWSICSREMCDISFFP